MDKKKLNKIDDVDVHIEQINQKEKQLNDLEKTAIFQFLFENEEVKDQETRDIEEELSKTQQLKILNAKRKKVVDEFELPKIVSKSVKKKDEEEDFELPKKSSNLSDTIKIKISDLRKAIEKKEQELEVKQVEEIKPAIKKVEKKKEEPKKIETTDESKKSLYDTIIIKLDDIINNRKALKSSSYLKVIKTSEPKYINEKKKSRVKDITKDNSVIINVDSKEFVSQLTNLNIANTFHSFLQLLYQGFHLLQQEHLQHIQY